MTHDEWVAAGYPHWQCRECKRIYCTIPIADDFLCPLCLEGACKCCGLKPWRLAAEGAVNAA